MRKCGGSERMKKISLLGIYETGSLIQIGSFDESGKKIDPYKKKMNKISQNPAILNGFHNFVQF